MKKILFGISMFVLFFFAISLSACEEKPCEHQEEIIAGKAATCTETGLTDGKKCSVCQEILVAQEEIEALGHTEETVAAKAPTCTETGLTEGKKCSVCHEVLVAQDVIPVSHTLTDVAEVAATCTENGNVAHKHCEECDKNFDAEGNELSDVVVPAGHTLTDVAEVAATCTENGNVAHKHCEVCNKNFDAEGNELSDVVVPASGHTFIDGSCECGEKYVAPVSGWALVTELKAGDKVLIGAPAYGKLLSAEKVNASSYYNKGVDYSTSDFSKVTDAEIFVVTVNADGTYTFTSLTGKVIALADSYSSLNETGAHKSWQLVDKGNGLFHLKNTGRSGYCLEWYASKGNWSTYTAANTDEYELSFYAQVESSGAEHVHNHISSVHAPTCTVDGYTTFTCSCGDSYTEAGEKAEGHKYSSEVTAPTCTVDGYTTFTCSCGDSYTEEGEKAEGHKYVDGMCSCGEEDPSLHVHKYSKEVTEPTCTVAGYTTYTCACGDTYTADEVAVVPHVDTNLDITCDFEGCTKRILPAADSKVSLFTANHMIIVSLNSNYYVEGVITEITDAKNGVFIIEDEDGYSILIRLPKDADGNSYTSWTTKVVVGDTVQVYGKPVRNSSAPTTEKAKVEGGVVTILKHEHAFSEATCTEPSSCACLVLGDPALGHIDEDADNSCDRCEWTMSWNVSSIVIATDPALANGVQTPGADGKTVSWTWSDDNFDATIAKGTSTFTVYTSAKAYMQLKKQNTFTLTNKISASIKTITISVTTADYLNSLETVLKNAGLTVTKDETALTVTIEWNKTEDFTFSNTSSGTININGVEVVYEK